VADRQCQHRGGAGGNAVVLAIVDLKLARQGTVRQLGTSCRLDAGVLERAHELDAGVSPHRETVGHHDHVGRGATAPGRSVGQRQSRQLLGRQERVEGKVAAAFEPPGPLGRRRAARPRQAARATTRPYCPAPTVA